MKVNSLWHLRALLLSHDSAPCVLIPESKAWLQFKLGMSIAAAHIPSLHLDSGSRFIKWSGAQNRVCIAQTLETLLVNFIWTSYYDEFHRDLPQRRGREHRVSTENLGASCVHCQVYSFYFPNVRGIRNPQHKSGNTDITSPSTGDTLHKVKSLLLSFHSRNSDPCNDTMF